MTKDSVLYAAGGAADFGFTPNDNGQYVVSLTLTADGRSTATTVRTVMVQNVAPTATLADNGPITYGETATVSFASQSDPSSADTTAGLHYAYATSSDGFAEVTYDSGSSEIAYQDFTGLEAGDWTLYARIIDKDGGFTQYSTVMHVNQRALTVMADAKSKVYGDADPALTCQITSGSLAFSDAFTGELSRVSGEDVGAYAIQQGTLVLSDNYDLTYVGVNLTISKADATISVSGYTGVYDGVAHGATGTAAGVGGADLSGSLNLGATFTDVPGGTADWTFDAGGNYNTASGDAAIAITKADQTINWTNPPSIVYGTPLDAVQFSATVTVVGPAPAGALTYSPPAGTILDGGSHEALSVTAATTQNYNEATKTVYIDVIMAPGSIYVLDPTVSGALTLSGNASINIPGNLVVDSNSSSAAISASGNATVKAAAVQVVGGVSKSGNASVTKTGTPGATGDPLAYLNALSASGGTSLNVSGNST